jgi:hypothetical protein
VEAEMCLNTVSRSLRSEVYSAEPGGQFYSGNLPEGKIPRCRQGRQKWAAAFPGFGEQTVVARHAAECRRMIQWKVFYKFPVREEDGL